MQWNKQMWSLFLHFSSPEQMQYGVNVGKSFSQNVLMTNGWKSQCINENFSVRIKTQSIMKTCVYNFDPHKPHFYIVKLWFTGVYIIFLISAQKHGVCIFLISAEKHRVWVLVRTSSRRFLRVPTIYVLSRNKKNIWIFHLKMFIFWW